MGAIRISKYCKDLPRSLWMGLKAIKFCRKQQKSQFKALYRDTNPFLISGRDFIHLRSVTM